MRKGTKTIMRSKRRDEKEPRTERKNGEDNKAGHDGMHLESWHLGARDRRIAVSTRPAWST